MNAKRSSNYGMDFEALYNKGFGEICSILKRLHGKKLPIMPQFWRSRIIYLTRIDAIMILKRKLQVPKEGTDQEILMGRREDFSRIVLDLNLSIEDL